MYQSCLFPVFTEIPKTAVKQTGHNIDKSVICDRVNVILSPEQKHLPSCKCLRRRGSRQVSAVYSVATITSRPFMLGISIQ